MRAQRFPLRVPVFFRLAGNDPWREAKTRNISASGVLLVADNQLQLETPVEFRVALTTLVQDDSQEHCEIAGLGHVVRLVDGNEQADRGFAVAIEQYEIRRRLARPASRAAGCEG
jgi:hypothetical protein